MGCRRSLDVQIDLATPAAKRLLLAGTGGDRRVTVLRARLVWKERHLRRAVAIGVNVEEYLQPLVLQFAQSEVVHLDHGLLHRREHDSGLAQHGEGAPPRRMG